MKRFSDNISPVRWKRICPPVDDSDSDSSESSNDTNIDFYRRLYRYGGPNCTQCGYPNLVCSCNVRNSLTSSRISLNGSRDSMILLETNEPSNRADGLLVRSDGGNNTSSSSEVLLSGLGSNNRTSVTSVPEVGPSDRASVSFRASTSIERFHPPTESSPPPRRRRFSANEVRQFVARELLKKSRDERLRELRPSEASASVVAVESHAAAVETSATNQLSEVSTNNELDEFHSRLLSLIECPVCLEPIAPPVHQCRRGHMVCAKCKSQLHQCPTCRDKMCEMRNWAIERIAELLKYPCRNAGLGCPVTTLLSSKTAHELSCSFRHYNCLFRTCSWTGFQQDMLPHLRSTHPYRFLEGSRQQIDLELNSPTLFYTDWAIVCFGRIFRLNFFQHIPHSMIYASAYLMDAGGDCASAGNSESDYTYTVTVNGSMGRRISYTRQTHAESTRTSQLCHSEDCFSFRGDQMEHFVQDGSALRLHVELEQLFNN